jgi:hypothetical protein
MLSPLQKRKIKFKKKKEYETYLNGIINYYNYSK